MGFIFLGRVVSVLEAAIFTLRQTFLLPFLCLYGVLSVLEQGLQGARYFKKFDSHIPKFLNISKTMICVHVGLFYKSVKC
jgi:hypothetical protein